MANLEKSKNDNKYLALQTQALLQALIPDLFCWLILDPDPHPYPPCGFGKP